MVVLVAAQFLRMPPPGWLPVGWEAIKAKVQRKVQQSTRDYTPGEMLRSGSFYLLYLMMTLVTASGLMLTAQLKPIGVTYGYDKYALFGGFTVLTLTLSLNQVLNGSARPFFGWVSDRIGRYDTMAIVFVMEAITITSAHAGGRTAVLVHRHLSADVLCLGRHLFAVPGGHRRHLWQQTRYDQLRHPVHRERDWFDPGRSGRSLV